MVAVMGLPTILNTIILCHWHVLVDRHFFKPSGFFLIDLITEREASLGVALTVIFFLHSRPYLIREEFEHDRFTVALYEFFLIYV